MSIGIQNLCYLLSVSLFIVGLKLLGHPRTAVTGNLIGALGMLVAVVVTLIAQEILDGYLLLIGIGVGSLIGALLAIFIQMTAMPQLVGLFNGLGGIASVLVASAVLYNGSIVGFDVVGLLAVTASSLIGAVTFWGSLVAFGKLQGVITEKPVRYPGEQIVKILFLLGALYLGYQFLQSSNVEMHALYYWILAGVASILGILLVIPIGGADMPIVIALLNSYSGLAATATGFVLDNLVLIVAGSLVGASGIILTSIMCKAMNRSLANVLFGGIGGVQEGIKADDIYEGKIKATSADEVALLLDSAEHVVFVPGYGMAVAHAQSAVRGITEFLESKDVSVSFGIHPVAGRMPGHMNVLLAEERISYEKLLDLDQVNAVLPQTDITIVLGANDVVNPLAREESGTPISGMPIINVDASRTVVVVKRSLSPGFAGLPNPLFAADNTLMLFGDGKKAMEEVLAALKDL